MTLSTDPFWSRDANLPGLKDYYSVNQTSTRPSNWLVSLRPWFGPAFVTCMLIGSGWFLHRELRDYHLRDFVDEVGKIDSRKVAAATALTFFNYIILFGYDWLGVRYIGHAMSWPRIFLASFLGSAVGNNFGTLLGGTTIRLRLYSAWGLSAVEIVKLVLVLAVTFWIGLFALAGVVFIVEPIRIPMGLHLPIASTVPLGVLLSVVALAYLVVCAFYHRPLKILQWEFSPPPLGLSMLQYCVATVDLMVAGAVLYVLLPHSLQVTYFQFLSVYLLALVAALFSQVPGGLGVLELIILVLLRPAEPHQLVGALMVFRAVYYLVPLALGLLLLGTSEVALNSRHVTRFAESARRWVSSVAPWILGVTLFLSGSMLLLSGATPAAAGRMRLLRAILPLPVVELSHLLGSIVGMLLLMLAHSIQRRIETAYYAVVLLLVTGIGLTLLKGFDYEESVVLTIMLIVFLPSRSYFYRKGALFTQRFSLNWYVALALVLVSTVWLMLFAYRHVEYSDDLWWRMSYSSFAPRSLRAAASVCVVLLLFGTSQLLRSKPRPPGSPTETDLELARQIISRSRVAAANLALLGDKKLLFNRDRSAFVMFGTEGRSWVALGDPVGQGNQQRELAWDFRELCDVGGRWPVFYQVDEQSVPIYVEMGLSLIKLGEEARVWLPTFSLDGSARKNLRRTDRQLTHEGCSFEIVEPPLGNDIMECLKSISDSWLEEKHVGEKRFSLGYFQPDYIRRCPVALIRREGRIIAFANLLRGSGNEELSVDLMRYVPDAPTGVMEFLFIQLLLWGRSQDYQWFNLGMAPLSGVDAQRMGPIWNHVAAIAYRYGHSFYNFQGLRLFKDKFDPVWRPKYLASPGGFVLPVILTNVVSLISGGLVEAVKR